MKPEQLSKTGYVGVKWHGPVNAYVARIRIHGKRVWLGEFETPEAAARAYDDAARTHHGEDALLNFPTPDDER